MKRSIETVVVVSIVTALIWVFAEGESLRTDIRTVDVVFASNGAAGRLVRVLDPEWDNSIRIELQGSATALAELGDRLRSRIAIEPDGKAIPMTPGRYSIRIEDALRQSSGLRDSGVTIVSADPSEVMVQVDSVETRSLPVRAVLPPDTVTTQLSVAPAQIDVIMPSSEAARLDTVAELEAVIPPERLRGLPEDQSLTLADVPVRLPMELNGDTWGVRLEPAAVRVTITLRSRTESLVLPQVPVWLAMAPSEATRFDVQLVEGDEWLRNVTVTGPGDVIGRIRSGEIPVIAYVSLDFEELESAIVSKEATFSPLPTSLRFQVDSRVVRLEITPVAVDAGSAPAALGPEGG